MADLSKATPRPWRRGHGCDISEGTAEIYSADGIKVAAVNTHPDPADWSANAALIVEAVNGRDELIAALRSAVQIAEEARQEWDAAPSGMRAGKLLIALGGNCKGYRADIDAIHVALAKAETP